MPNITKVSQSEEALSSLFMYLYQAYLEELSDPSKSKKKVVQVVNSRLNDFTNLNNGNGLKKSDNKTNNNDFLLSEIGKDIDSLVKTKENKFIIERLKYNFNKLKR